MFYSGPVRVPLPGGLGLRGPLQEQGGGLRLLSSCRGRHQQRNYQGNCDTSQFDWVLTDRLSSRRNQSNPPNHWSLTAPAPTVSRSDPTGRHLPSRQDPTRAADTGPLGLQGPEDISMKTSPLEPWTRPTVGRSSRLSSTKSPWKRMRTTSPPITAPRVLVGAVQPWSVTKHSSPLTLTEPCNVISVHEIFSQCLVSSLLQLSASLLPVTPYHACIAWLSWSLTIALVILAKPTDI